MTMNDTMNPEVKADWVAALRSGEFEQNQCGALSLEVDGKVKHCCPGVLCVLAVRSDTIPAPERTPRGVCQYGAYKTTAYLPRSVAEWAGIEHKTIQFSLAKMNDELRLSFRQIADYIEQNM